MLYRNPSYVTKAIVAVCMVAVLFAIATQMAYASSKSAPRPYKTSQISLKESASPGTLCLGDVMGYQVTSTALGGSTYVECNGTVTAIDVVNRIYYCTSGIPSLDICFNWQLKTIASSCVGGLPMSSTVLQVLDKIRTQLVPTNFGASNLASV